MADAEVERLRDQFQAIAEVVVEEIIVKRRVLPTSSAREARPDHSRERARSAALRLIAEPQRHAIEERAAIMEFDGGVERDRAERHAVLNAVQSTVTKEAKWKSEQ